MGQARLSTPTDIPDPFVRFQRLLGRIEKASDQISAARLAEHWPEDEEDDDMTHEFEFETTLHALVRAQKLSAQGGSNETVFPVPSKLNRWDVNQFAGANILHLGDVTGEHPCLSSLFSLQCGGAEDDVLIREQNRLTRKLVSEHQVLAFHRPQLRNAKPPIRPGLVQLGTTSEPAPRAMAQLPTSGLCRQHLRYRDHCS
jgi:hypothetical protein